MRHSLFLLILCVFNINMALGAEIAIIGGGAAAATTALLTQDAHDVTLYEAEPQLGGHVKTQTITTAEGKTTHIDTGAEFFNRPAYPNFLKLLTYLGIAASTFTLTFNFYQPNKKRHLVMPPIHNGKIEFDSFRPSNLFKMIQLRWLIYRGQSLVDNPDYTITLESFLDSQPFFITKNFKNNFLYPMLGAAWGVPVNEIKEFAAFQTLKYLIDGHRAGNQWLEIDGGAIKYIQALENKLTNTTIERNSRIVKIIAEGKQYRVYKGNGESKLFDHVVFGTNTRITRELINEIDGLDEVKAALSKTSTYISKLDLCEATGRNLKYKPDNPQVVNIRWDGQETSITFTKPWNSSALRIWLTHDIRNQTDADENFENPIVTEVFEHPVLNTHYFEAYRTTNAENGRKGLWYAGIRGNDSHEAAIDTAIGIAEKLVPNNPKIKQVFC